MLGRVACSLLSMGVLGACARTPPPVDPVLSPSLEAAADALARAAMPGGKRLQDPLVGVVYAAEAGNSWTLPLQATQCYAFGFATDPGVARFAVALWGPTNKRLQVQHAKQGQGMLQYCATQTGPYRLDAKVTSGAGHFVLVGYTPSDAPPVVVQAVGGAVVAPAVDVSVVAAAPGPQGASGVNDVIEHLASSVAPGAQRVGDLYDGIGDESAWTPTLEAGKCYSFLGAGDPARVKALSLFLSGPTGARVTENRGRSEVTTLAHCAKVTGAYKLEAKVTWKPGPMGAYEVGVYAR